MTGKLTGTIIITAGLVMLACFSFWILSGLAEAQITESGLRLSGALLGLAGILILALPFLGVGAYMIVQGQREARELAEVEKEKKILNMVQTQGKVMLPNVAVELGASMAQVKNYIYDLVGKGLFTGYIDWQSSTLYAKEAGAMQSTKCPNCGGVRELVGKGVVKCPYCGAELFLPPSS